MRHGQADTNTPYTPAYTPAYLPVQPSFPIKFQLIFPSFLIFMDTMLANAVFYKKIWYIKYKYKISIIKHSHLIDFIYSLDHILDNNLPYVIVFMSFQDGECPYENHLDKSSKPYKKHCFSPQLIVSLKIHILIWKNRWTLYTLLTTANMQLELD